MGNSESHSNSSSPAHSIATLDSAQRRLKSHKVKSPGGNVPQVGSSQQKKSPAAPAGTAVFYDTDNIDADMYHTCKPDVGASTHSKMPAYYFTASQLHRSKSRSKSQDADLNRISSDGQKPDVRHIPWSPLTRNSDTDAVSMIYFFLV